MENILKNIFKSCVEISNLLREEVLENNTNTLINESGDNVKDKDIICNDIFYNNLSSCKDIIYFVSEEDSDKKLINCSGKYYITLDPLDGSSNVDNNNIVGSIFCIFKVDKNKNINSGRDILLAGYCLYGPSTQLVMSSKENTYIYQLYGEEFKIIKDKIIVPNSGKFYSCNYYKKNNYFEYYLNGLNKLECNNKKNRWSGCMVADFHRILLNGGVYMYPASHDNLNGKIRLLYEILPFSFIIENCNGKSYNHSVSSLLDIPIDINNLHQKEPVILSSKKEYNYFN